MKTVSYTQNILYIVQANHSTLSHHQRDFFVYFLNHCSLSLFNFYHHSQSILQITSDMIPLILLGFRLQRMTAMRFCISSSGINFTSPEMTVLHFSSPTSTLKRICIKNVSVVLVAFNETLSQFCVSVTGLKTFT